MFKVLGLIAAMFIKEVASNCVTFSVGPETGCSWMCNYCAIELSTDNYYFTDDVCTYQTGGCVGNPQVGVSYACCSINNDDEL